MSLVIHHCPDNKEMPSCVRVQRMWSKLRKKLKATWMACSIGTESGCVACSIPKPLSPGMPEAILCLSLSTRC